MQTNMCPRTLSAGAPYIVDSSVSGSASPSFRTLLKCIALLSDWKLHKKMMPGRSELFNVAKAAARLPLDGPLRVLIRRRLRSNKANLSGSSLGLQFGD